MSRYEKFERKWNKALEAFDKSLGLPLKDDWYRTGLKLGDWVKHKGYYKAEKGVHFTEDYYRENKDRIFKIVYIHEGRFAVLEWMCPESFISVFVGHDMRDIEKVDIENAKNKI